MKVSLLGLLLVTSVGCELIANIPATSSSALIDGGDIDGTGDTGAALCATAEDCAAPTPACFVPTGTCVECVAASDCATAEPVCGTDHTCRTCAEDVECGADGVCLLDGTCAAMAAILHAAPDGMGAACSAAAPCTLQTAVTRLTAAEYIIKLAPVAFEVAETITVSSPAAMIAGSGATLHGAASGAMFAPLLSVTGNDLLVTGVTFDLASRIGLVCGNAKTTLFRTTVTGGLVGMYTTGTCDLAIDRSVFRANNLYAVSHSAGGQLAVRNSIFSANGNATNTLAPLIVASVAGTIEHVTFANNASDGSKSAVDCTDSPGLKITGIISVGHGATLPATCDVSYSSIEAGYVGPGTHNVTLEPMFVDAPAGNYHLQPTSPVRGLGDPANMLATDLDGEPRPQPAATPRDLGADEVP